MKYDPSETYESWANRVQMFENGHALQRIANGEPVDKVLEDMARRITEKLMHPILKQIEKMPTVGYDPVESRKHYDETYTQKFGTKADHVLDDNIDKAE